MTTRTPLLLQATPAQVVRGEGVWLYGADDRRYLDFTSGIGVTSTGHCHPAVVEAIREQAGRLIHGQVTTVMHPRLDELTDLLCSTLPDGLDTAFVSSSGGEAVESALRLARHATGRPNLIAFQGGFHGRSIGAASITTSKLAVRAGLQPLMAGVVLAPFPAARRWGWTDDEATEHCLRELDQLFVTTTAPDETAAMIIEPVLGEGGYLPVPDAFLAGLRERCDRHGILLIADEVQTGVGRTGQMWAMEHSGVRPDVVVTAKGLASGMPLSAIVAPVDLMAKGFPGSQGGTYVGNPVACAAAIATLEVVRDEGLVERSSKMGARLIDGARALAERHPVIADVRGRGLMVGIELADRDGRSAGEASRAVLAAAAEADLLLLTCGPTQQVVRLIPPLVVGEDEIDEGLARLDGALAAAG